MKVDAAEMIEKHTPFLYWWAERYCRMFPTIALDDLVQEGRMGIVEACEKFDPARGIKFISFANFKIRGRMSKHCKNQCQPVRVPCWNFHRLHFNGWDEPANQGDSPTLAEIIPAEDEELPCASSEADLEIRMAKLLRRLTEKEREVIHLLFWEDKTLREIASMPGRRVTHQAVSYIKIKALKKLRRLGTALKEAA